jgi:hypothetical protein
MDLPETLRLEGAVSGKISGEKNQNEEMEMKAQVCVGRPGNWECRPQLLHDRSKEEEQ